jgi:hypothetical protein
LGLELESSSKSATRKFDEPLAGEDFTSPKHTSEGSSWINPSSGKRQGEEAKGESEEPPENAMEAKLRRMQLELRGQLGNNEDRQGYYSYKSPIAANKKLEFVQEKP